VAGDGRYAIVVLPNLDGIDLAAMEKIARFCREGGTVIATRRLPERVYGRDQEEATKRLRALLAAMFGPNVGAGFTVADYGQGKAVFAPDDRADLARALSLGAAGQDMRIGPEFDRSEITHVHRRVGQRDFYFVVNVGSRPATFTAAFRVGKKAAFQWNPM